ncbi:MAG: hypothetical protein JWQ27_266 [Ferruginibacter sp.]|nr:hypothetical protein [Ferruginibacter sp.]
MAFTVKMIHGRHTRLEVFNDGHLKLGGKDEDFALFSCGGIRWDQMRLLGQYWGWIPKGCMSSLGNDEPRYDRLDYSPSSWNGENEYKTVAAEDASALGKALELFLEHSIYLNDEFSKISCPASIEKGGLAMAKYELLVKELSPGLIKKFIEFVFKGEFIFVWDD